MNLRDLHDPTMDVDGGGTTNGKRAAWAAEIMQRWEAMNYQGGEEELVMAGDLIADLCHWLHSKGELPSVIRERLEIGWGCFEEECTPEPEPEEGGDQ